MHNGNIEAHRSKASLAVQVRDTLVLNEALLVELVNEVLTSQPPHKAELFRRRLKGDAQLGTAIKRVVVDVGIVLSLAKTLESDDEFADSACLVDDIDFATHDGLVGEFAKAMVECDLRSVTSAQGEDAVLYDLLPQEALERRLQLVLEFFTQASMQAH